MHGECWWRGLTEAPAAFSVAGELSWGFPLLQDMPTANTRVAVLELLQWHSAGREHSWEQLGAEGDHPGPSEGEGEVVIRGPD